MDQLTPDQADRLYEATDRLRLHGDWVVVPLPAASPGAEFQFPDGKILLRAPASPVEFAAWLAGLPARLESMNLAPVPRSHEDDPKFFLTGPGEPQFFGTH